MRREEFLENIRHRTRSGRYQPTRAPDASWTPDRRAAAAREIGDPPSRFLEELAALGGHGRRVKDLEEARDYVVELARERGARLLVRWDVEELERLGADGPLREAGVEVAVWRDLEDFREVAGRADIGLSTAEWAIAETGSLVLESGPGKGRTVAILPPVYVAVVPVERLVRTVPEAIRMYAGRGSLPQNLCFHTGPSRSGDIEQSLATGVHGPGEVHVLLLG
ncbi:Lactate utilization protein C [Rubrobacter xylanophilus DSM 9941]|uniref:LutC/YkgG family protein n=1 Tax=Rubrobacter xylanophilus TaxID=49319 RepID=UPI001C63BA82|nr:lactate utilization protein [Rubrobacter xylanophilus]QYJ16034.1 Lactate utilization protein C [Rubrobacter xylanophilus DSM 9941]